MPGERDITKAIEQQALGYFKETPKAVVVVVMSFFSGHLWVFIVTAFLRSKTRGNRLLESRLGRTAVGMFWFTGVLVPLYLLKFGAYDFEYQRILDIVIPTLVTGMFLQLIVFAFFARFGDRK